MKFTYYLLLYILIQSTIGISQQWTPVSCQGHAEARHESGMAEVNGQLYLIGGRGERSVDKYDPATNTWTKRAKPPLEMHHFQAIAYRHEIYIVGGFTGKFPHEKPLTHIQIYDTMKDKWRKGPAVPSDRLRGAAGVTIYQDKLYIICGIQDGHWDGHVAWLDEYDLKTGKWRKLPDAPRARDHFHAAVHEGKLYVAGGRRSSAKTKEFLNLTVRDLDVFDFTTGQWNSNDAYPLLPTPRAGSTTVAFDNQILVIGGESTKQEQSHNEVEAYNIKEQKWEILPSLLQGRHGMQAVVIGDKVYVVAGSANRGGGPELNTMEVLEK